MKSPPADSIALLQCRLNEGWAATVRARAKTVDISRKIEKALSGLSSTDASIVVFGSLARSEWTSKSDVDWTLLVDGQAERVSGTPLEVERRFSDPIRLESGCESLERRENRREQTLSHHHQEGY